MATLAMEQAAAAAAANIKSLLPPLLSSLFFISTLTPSVALEALATMSPLRGVVEGCLAMAEPVRNEAVMQAREPDPNSFILSSEKVSVDATVTTQPSQFSIRKQGPSIRNLCSSSST
ncbi:hypothetical protein NC652_023073 [Populus alba x Populus x berolinensis]|nr:hypothetical protein NC652_023073 [Populus alba x Populus x berolinensis]